MLGASSQQAQTSNAEYATHDVRWKDEEDCSRTYCLVRKKRKVLVGREAPQILYSGVDLISQCSDERWDYERAHARRETRLEVRVQERQTESSRHQLRDEAQTAVAASQFVKCPSNSQDSKENGVGDHPPRHVQPNALAMTRRRRMHRREQTSSSQAGPSACRPTYRRPFTYSYPYRTRAAVVGVAANAASTSSLRVPDVVAVSIAHNPRALDRGGPEDCQSDFAEVPRQRP